MIDSVTQVSGEVRLNPELPDASAGNWYVLHTRSRQEKILAGWLAEVGIGFFLPLVRQARFYGTRKLMVELPLFTGYIFIRGSREDAYLADRTRRVAQIIMVPDQDTLDWELRNLHFALLKQAPLDIYPYLTKGTRVEVRAGPMRGLQGVVHDRCKPDRLLLQVEMLGRAVSLEIDGALLDPLN